MMLDMLILSVDWHGMFLFFQCYLLNNGPMNTYEISPENIAKIIGAIEYV